MGRNLRDHDPFPKFDEGITPKRITLALGLDVPIGIANSIQRESSVVFLEGFWKIKL